MCGIYGCLAPREGPAPDAGTLARMAVALVHRGPDQGGEFVNHPVALGSRRLSITAPASGRQPLQNEDGTIHLVCNGEIYNSPGLRRELAARHSFRTESDVEVLIHLYEEEGIEFLERVEGMFALALWDARRRTLLLARDRMGEKPLFYAHHDGTTWFASELSAIRQAEGVGTEPDYDALRLYLTLGYFISPRSTWSGVRKVEPGTMLLFQPGARQPRLHSWWSLRESALEGARHAGPDRDIDSAARRLLGALTISVEQQLVADVPVGLSLSGGLDSSLIGAIAAARSPRPIETFTISFSDHSYDESPQAQEISRHLGSRHRVVHAGHAALVDAINSLVPHMGEPLGDPALLPTFLLAREVGKEVTVLLGGEGADELFGGYPTYLGHRAAAGYNRLPGWMRHRLIEPMIRALPPSESKVSLEFLLKRFVQSAANPPLARHLAWFGILPPGEADALAGPLLHSGGDSIDPVAELERLLEPIAEWENSSLDSILYLDTRTYLAEGLLTKLDRVMMACSVESRSPFLARRVVECAARMPIEWKARGLMGKKVLRLAARGLVPNELLRRKKRGLSVPLASLFRQELRGLLLDELEPGKLDRTGLLNGPAVHRMVTDHLSGRVDRSRPLWGILALVLWHKHHATARLSPTASTV